MPSTNVHAALTILPCLQCNATSLVQTGPLAGGCTAMTIQYNLVQGKEADTKISNAGGARA